MLCTQIKLGIIFSILTAAAYGCAAGGPDKGSRASGAGGSGNGGASGDTCVPGAQVECACPGGAAGVQECRADGSGYEACIGCSSSMGGGGDASTGSTDGGSPPDGAAPDTGKVGPPADAGSPDTATSAACPGGPTEIDLHSATIYSNPPDLADWPMTTTITEADFTSDGIHLVFDKMDGAGRWPDVTPPGWGGPLQYTIGMVECIGGAWYTSAVVEVWYGLPAAGGNVAEDTVSMAQCTAFGAGSTCQVAANWYYDTIRWGMLAGRQPATGETVGLFVAAGNLRNITADDPAQSPVMERSNVVLVPFPDITGATHSL